MPCLPQIVSLLLYVRNHVFALYV